MTLRPAECRRRLRCGMGFARRCLLGAGLVAAMAVSPALAAGQQAAQPTDPAEVARVRRGLETKTPLKDAAMSSPVPDFRVSVTEKIDIWKFWGDDPTAVSAMVRPSGGPWHHEFQNMVTPDEFKGYGGILGNGEKLQLAATSLAFAGAMQLVGAGVRQAKEALAGRARSKAKEEVQRELAEFCAEHPGACVATPLTPLTPP
jgi:hypothetical protein